MQRILVHREGQSGHFFLALLEKFDPSSIKFRIPDELESEIYNLKLTHDVDYARHCAEYDQVLRIMPTHKIYHSIYNNFMKKLVVEQATMDFKTWKQNPIAWYDVCFYNIVEYHGLITQDIQQNQYVNVIDFDQLLNEDYMNSVLNKYFGENLDSDRQALLNKYRQLQLQIDIDSPVSTMQEIVANLDDALFEQNPWFFSYCVHKYEKNNGLTEADRKWSVDNIDQIQTKHHLLRLAECY